MFMISFRLGWQILELRLPVCYELFPHLLQTTNTTTLYIPYCLHYSDVHDVQYEQVHNNI